MISIKCFLAVGLLLAHLVGNPSIFNDEHIPLLVIKTFFYFLTQNVSLFCSFGSKIKKISSKGIGSFNSLGGRDKLDSSGLESHEYVMKIVPTTYEDLHGVKLVAYQYTYAYRYLFPFDHLHLVMN